MRLTDMVLVKKLDKRKQWDAKLGFYEGAYTATIRGCEIRGWGDTKGEAVADLHQKILAQMPARLLTASS